MKTLTARSLFLLLLATTVISGCGGGGSYIP